MSGKQLLEALREALSYELVVIAGTPLTGATMLIFAAIIIVTFWFAGILQRTVERLLLRRSPTGEDSAAGRAGVFSRLIRYLILMMGLSVGFHTIGINLSALFAAGALFAVAIGFAMQNVVANFVSGVILLAERVIKPGDILEVDGAMVQVSDMGIRATVVRTQDDEDLVVPNGTLVQSNVKNFTLTDRLYRLRVIVGVSYDSDLKVVEEVLGAAATEVEWRAQKRRPVVLLTQFGSSSVDYEVSVWIDKPWQNRQRRSDLRQAIWWAFKDSSITIAFPQLDVHLDRPVVDAFGNRGAA